MPHGFGWLRMQMHWQHWYRLLEFPWSPQASLRSMESSRLAVSSLWKLFIAGTRPSLECLDSKMSWCSSNCCPKLRTIRLTCIIHKQPQLLEEEHHHQLQQRHRQGPKKNRLIEWMLIQKCIHCLQPKLTKLQLGDPSFLKETVVEAEWKGQAELKDDK